MGNPTRSAIHAFTLKPDGAGFALDTDQKIVSGVLPTGMDFGPDGALYFTDWINGWGTKNYGRMWKLDVTEGIDQKQRAATKQLLQSDYEDKKVKELESLLAYPDKRIRLKAQFELAKRGEDGAAVFLSALRQMDNQLARVHAVWGTAQLARQNAEYAKPLIPYLEDEDSEIAAQAAKWLGDLRYEAASSELIMALQHPSSRVRFFAAEALGRIGYSAATQPLLRMLATNDDQDVYLRHAGAFALAQIGNVSTLLELSENPSRSLRIAAVVALRRLQHPEVARFLADKDEYIVAEAARAINDDWSIEAALPDLAKLVRDKRLTNEAVLRRAINACSRVGTPEALAALTELALRKSAPEAMRVEALAALS
ncbi:MAG: HEAT repeat domain-containing protein, partial [Bacteroidota bacterium]